MIAEKRTVSGGADGELYECLLVISELAKEYVGGRDVKKQMAKELKRLDGLWVKLLDEMLGDV